MKQNLGFTEGLLVEMSKDHSNKSTHRVFDWIKAANLIKEHCMIGDLLKTDSVVNAGLSEDWGCTSGVILKNGSVVSGDDTYVYLHSSWATPIIEIDGEDYECWECKEDSIFEAKTLWPQESLDIINIGGAIK